MKARKIAQDELTASMARQEAQLLADQVALQNYEIECSKGIVTTEQFNIIMAKASASAKEYAISTNGVAGSTDAFVAKQKAAQAQLKATANDSKK